MNAVIKCSVILAILVWVVSVIFTATGMHKGSPMLGFLLLFVFIALNAMTIFWVLKQSAADNGYGKQLMYVVIFGLIAGLLIGFSSVVNLKFLFPNYLDESATAVIEFLEGMNMPEEALEQQIAKVEGRTVWSEARNGAIGTFFTSLIIGAIVAIFKRKK